MYRSKLYQFTVKKKSALQKLRLAERKWDTYLSTPWDKDLTQTERAGFLSERLTKLRTSVEHHEKKLTKFRYMCWHFQFLVNYHKQPKRIASRIVRKYVRNCRGSAHVQQFNENDSVIEIIETDDVQLIGVFRMPHRYVVDIA